MEVSLDDFRRHFEMLSDETLLSTNREELVENARQCYDEEVARRGLNSPAEDVVEEGASAEPATDSEALVLVATYNIPEEANFARGLLESAGIPFLLENEHASFGVFQLRMMVPASLEEQAREVLETEISDEELAAQAEAAGLGEDEADESEAEDPALH